MAQVTIGSSFKYGSQLHTVWDALKQKLSKADPPEQVGDSQIAPPLGASIPAYDPSFEKVMYSLEDRDAQLEDFLSGPFPVFDQVLTEDFTSSTTFVTLGGPIVTARLPKGAAIVHGGGTLQATVAASTLQIGLFIDGVQFQNTMAVLNIPNNAAAQGDPVWVTGGSTYLVSGLSPGDHTFELRYRSVTGTGANFSNRFLQVSPLKGTTTT